MASDELAAPCTQLPIDGSLPTDILFEILVRVPARELCRATLVCRSWRSLTTDPHFSKGHAARHPLVVCLRTRYDQKTSEFHFFDLSGKIVKQIQLPMCGYEMNGHLDLVCAYGHGYQSRVLNPATGTATALPDRKNANGGHMCVVGFVPLTGEYKVLRIYSYKVPVSPYSFDQPCEVITLRGSSEEQGGWRTRQDPPICVQVDSQSMASVGGVVYFLLSRYGFSDANIEPDGIASFDLATEEWRAATLRGPLSTHCASATNKPAYRKYRQDLQLAKLDGHLVTIHRSSKSSTDIWFLDDADKGLWIKKYCLQYDPKWTQPYPLRPLDEGRILVWKGAALTVYDPEIKTWTSLTNMDRYCKVQMHEGNLLC